MPYLVWLKGNDAIVSYKHIRPIPPKPKTLREEVEDLDKDENISTYALKQFLAIIDCHEKGGENV
jgi:hypothetical protein